MMNRYRVAVQKQVVLTYTTYVEIEAPSERAARKSARELAADKGTDGADEDNSQESEWRTVSATKL